MLAAKTAITTNSDGLVPSPQMLHQHVKHSTQFFRTGGLKLKSPIPAKVDIQNFTYQNMYLKSLFYLLKAIRFKTPGQKNRVAIGTNKQKNLKQVKMPMKAQSSR